VKAASQAVQQVAGATQPPAPTVPGPNPERGDFMSDINLVKPHSLPIAKAKALVQQAVDELAVEHDLNSEWHRDTLHVHRSGVEGQMQVTDSEIRVDVNLSFLLRPFKAKLVDHIERTFERLFPRPKSSGGRTGQKVSA
jgi:putative polyhydroxyalkanoate system protein